MLPEFSVETYPRCENYGVNCDGYKMLEVVEQPDGTVVFKPVSPRCGREYCERRDEPERVIERLKSGWLW